MSDTTETRSPEVIYGVDAIAKAINAKGKRHAYYLLEKGYVPGAFKTGNTWSLSIPAYRKAVHGEAS